MNPGKVLRETLPFLTTASGLDITRMVGAALPPELVDKLVKRGTPQINYAEAPTFIGIQAVLDESQISGLDASGKEELSTIVIGAMRTRLDLLNKDASVEVFQSKFSFAAHCVFLALSVIAILVAIGKVLFGNLEAGVVTTICGALSGWLSQGPFKLYTEAKKRENSSLRDIELIKSGLTKLGFDTGHT